MQQSRIPTSNMNLTKKLHIKVSTLYDGSYTTLPVNTGEFILLSSEIGDFLISVFIRNFDGSQPHINNSVRNVGDSTFLNGENFEPASLIKNNDCPNLRILVKFKPKYSIIGSDLLFGNDCTSSIKEYVPTTLLATGLKFFSWFINPTIKGDIMSETPFLYAPALNSFSKIGRLNEASSIPMILSENTENLSYTPAELLNTKSSSERIKFYSKLLNCETFTFEEGVEYLFAFDTNFLRMGDSKYNVAIPTYGERTFNIDVLRYANEELDNFNWIIKLKGFEGVYSGTLGVVLNFSLLEEST